MTSRHSLDIVGVARTWGSSHDGTIHSRYIRTGHSTRQKSDFYPKTAPSCSPRRGVCGDDRRWDRSFRRRLLGLMTTRPCHA
jgi:hypothetical protein